MYKIKRILVFIIVVALTVSSLSVSNVSAASKVKLNKKKVTMYVGKTITLKLKNNKKKIKWSSSNKKVVTVSKKGKVKAKKVGRATITAKVGKKKYKCKVTVKKKKTVIKKPEITTTKRQGNPTTVKDEETTKRGDEDNRENTSEGKCGDSAKYTLDKNGKMIIEGSGEVSSIFKNSETIDEKAIKEVVIKEGITALNDEVFVDCENINKVSLPESLKKIEYGVFLNCKNLKNIYIPKKVEGEYSLWFQDCSQLTEIKVSTDNKYFCSIDGVLYNKDCTEILTVPVGKKMESYNIPDGVTSVFHHAFYGCEDLRNIHLSDSIIKIGRQVFWGCKSLKEITIPKNVKEIDTRWMLWLPERGWAGTLCDGCDSLENIHVDEKNEYFKSIDGVLYKKIEEEWQLLLYPCGNKREEFTIPENVASIGDYAFDRCSALKEIIIPDSVTSIGYGVFGRCDSLQQILGNKGSFAEYYASEYNLKFECLDGEVTAENIEEKGVCGKSAYYTLYKNGELVIGGFGSTSDFSFQGNDKIKQVVIENGIKEIGARSFWNCENMCKIVIPESVTKIGDYAFDEAGSNSEYEFFEMENYYGLRIIGKKGSVAEECAKENEFRFYEMDDMGKAIIKSGTCGESVRYKLNEVGLLTINGNGSASFSWYEFEEYPLKEIVINEGITSFSINSGTLWHKKIIFPSTIEKIDMNCLSGGSLVNIEVSDENKIYCTRDGVLFEKTDDGLKLLKYPEKKNEKKYTIDEDVIEIGEGAFSGCSALKEITITKGVMSIGSYAFYDCSSLEQIIGTKGSYAETYAKENNIPFTGLQ